ncbi:hypothetical protein GP486_005374 [Trichoglossum hirsutum]|uniref:Subtilisin n=1 Tax=Trichoglossum hirsutum TaxID=265104 RepID=A0A9P8RMD7_9PEZI|nr:hypothetical protein GP486_005374 [Trichoglossum hirsutum]
MDHKVDLLWKLGDNVYLSKYLPSNPKILQSLGSVESALVYDMSLKVRSGLKTELNPDITKDLNGIINFKTVRKNLAIGIHNNMSAVIMGVGRSNQVAFTNRYPESAALTGAGSVNAICDTGVDTNHAAFAGNGTVVPKTQVRRVH